MLRNNVAKVLETALKNHSQAELVHALRTQVKQTRFENAKRLLTKLACAIPQETYRTMIQESLQYSDKDGTQFAEHLYNLNSETCPQLNASILWQLLKQYTMQQDHDAVQRVYSEMQRHGITLSVSQMLILSKLQYIVGVEQQKKLATTTTPKQ